MRKSIISARFNSDVEKVWQLLTENEDVSWRSDINKVVVADDKKSFTEYGKDANPTIYTIAESTPGVKYAVSMRNHRMTGRKEFVLEALPGGGTKMECTEEMEMKTGAMRLLAPFFLNLKKIQRAYVEDMRRALGETSAEE